jgi:hypothetical protein
MLLLLCVSIAFTFLSLIIDSTLNAVALIRCVPEEPSDLFMEWDETTLVRAVSFVESSPVLESQPLSCFALAVVRLPHRIILDRGEDSVTIAGLAVDPWRLRERWSIGLRKSDDVSGHHSLVAALVMVSQCLERHVEVDPFRKQL